MQIKIHAQLLLLMILLMVALCVTENDRYVLHRAFSKHFLHHLCTDFAKLPNNVGSLAIENVLSTFC